MYLLLAFGKFTMLVSIDIVVALSCVRSDVGERLKIYWPDLAYA
jgi:hypothetical protein